jgi:hypothetical protein
MSTFAEQFRVQHSAGIGKAGRGRGTAVANERIADYGNAMITVYPHNRDRDELLHRHVGVPGEREGRRGDPEGRRGPAARKYRGGR